MQDQKEVFKRKCSNLLTFESVDLKVSEDRAVNSPGLSVGRDRTECDYKETRIGQRAYVFRMKPERGAVSKIEAYCDGEKCVQIHFDPKDITRQSQVHISRGFLNEQGFGYKDVPEPLRLVLGWPSAPGRSDLRLGICW